MLDIRHAEVLDDASRRLASHLASLDFAPDCYLAGGAALALYLGHRPARSLDLMGYFRLLSPQRRDILQALLAPPAGLIAPKVETARDGYLSLSFAIASYAGDETGNEPEPPTKVRLFYYPYPLIDAEHEIESLAVASALDLGLMKLGAIISRGTRRDFVDLFLLCKQLPLAELLERSVEKFGHVRDFPLQALKGLADISIAVQEPMPRLLSAVEWDEVEAWLRGEVRELARQYVGLDGVQTLGAPR